MGQPRLRTRRQPEESVLYRVFAEHLETFFARLDQDPAAPGLPGFVRRELRSFLDCGVLVRGLCRVHCTACGRDDVVAFACKGRGFCPSCGARRMSDTAAWLVDRVLPEVPVRQWVLSLPARVRFLCVREPEVWRGVRQILVRGLSSFYRRRVPREARTRTGCVAFTQRFDSALRLNVHFHTLWPDGVFEFRSWRERAGFHRAPAPSGEEVEALCRALGQRI
ncbi:MAG: transposase zinc-binding domain-containing protein, partial [Planctomycetota bacterium]